MSDDTKSTCGGAEGQEASAAEETCCGGTCSTSEAGTSTEIETSSVSDSADSAAADAAADSGGCCGDVPGVRGDGKIVKFGTLPPRRKGGG